VANGGVFKWRANTPQADESPKSSSFLGTVRLALSLVWAAGRALVVFIAITNVVTSVAIAAQLLIGRELLDLITSDGDVEPTALAPYLLGLGAIMLVSALSQAVSTELRVPLGERVARDVTEKVLEVATEVDIEAFEGPDFHDRLARANAGASGSSSAVVWGIVTMMTTFFVTIGVSAVLFTVAPILVPIVVIGYLPVAFVNMRNNKALHRMEWDLAEVQRQRAYIEFLLTQRNEAKEIRSYGISPMLLAWHDQRWDERFSRLRLVIRRRLTLTTLATLLTTFVMIGTLAIALVLAVRGTITIGDAAVAIVGLQQLNGRLRAAGVAFAGTHQGITFLRDFEAFRDMLPELRSRRPTAAPPVRPEVLTVSDVDYRYPGSTEDAVKSVSFELRRGQILAIVGANGSGKSTLTKVLCGLLPPAHGAVMWDGVDIASCDPELVQTRIAPVFQDFARYFFPLRAAIGLGDVRRMDDLDGIRQAAADAGVEYLFDTLANGPDAQLGKMFTGGTDLSIGQWQRLAIARAFFRDAPIVILDEPSASLDPQGEAELFDLLHELGKDRIVVFVSHRLATVRTADFVMVMDQGSVVELGSHDDLMLADGLYSGLFKVQADRYGFAS
jgi:ATP-binding cassette, subfamily B, bacterial